MTHPVKMKQYCFVFGTPSTLYLHFSKRELKIQIYKSQESFPLKQPYMDLCTSGSLNKMTTCSSVVSIISVCCKLSSP